MTTLDNVLERAVDTVAHPQITAYRANLVEMLAPIPSYENPLASVSADVQLLIETQARAFKDAIHGRVKSAMLSHLHNQLVEVGREALRASKE